VQAYGTFLEQDVGGGRGKSFPSFETFESGNRRNMGVYEMELGKFSNYLVHFFYNHIIYCTYFSPHANDSLFRIMAIFFTVFLSFFPATMMEQRRM